MEIERVFKHKYKRSYIDDLAVFWRLIREHRIRLFLALLCSAALSGINGAIAWAVKPAMDEIFMKKSVDFLYLLTFGIFVMFLLRGSLTFINNYLMSSIGAKIVRKVRDRAYEKLLRLPMSFYHRDNSGNIISKVLNDVEILRTTVSYTIKDFFVEGLTVIVLAGVAFYRRWDLALLSLIVLPLIIYAITGLGKRLKEIGMKTRLKVARITTLLHETLSGIKVIRAFTMENDMIRRHKDALQAHYRNVMREVRTSEFSHALTETISGLGVAMILFYGGYLVVNDKISSGDFFSFLTAVFLMYTPLRRLSRVNSAFQIGRNVIERLREIIFAEEEPKIDKTIPIRGDITFKNVSFKYPNSKEYVLRNLNFEIKAGETVAIVGPSGAGKSTIVDLIAGFWYPSEGEILIDGVNIKELSLENLRSQIAIVSQDIFLFNDTVTNNIRFGRVSSTKEQIEDAAKMADAHDFIKNLPDGYESVVGERGVLLSGGQKQRITIARAILREPKILIFDEATANLDTESEEKIQRALEEMRKGRTTIVIAHRLSTIKRADKIIVMDKGHIVEQGSHEELLVKGGLYSELWHLQFSETSHS